MGLSLLCALLVFAGVAPAEADMLDLNEMVRQVTGKIPIFFYSSYGCYCGIGGQGQPRDATDWCCYDHNCCYGYLTPHNCDYLYDHYDYTFFQGNVQCSTKGSWCEQQLCACDKTLAFCLQRNLNTYKNHLRHLSRCEGETLACPPSS
ncbi:PREDICTED: group IID secretory phospholipase A2 isoform X3 [Bison bison bison]|uniref:Phospholipase A2 n=1 Tax=Bison bison bison TaxID=43346 RepID=A0A6P3GNK1_BISBB|nr:PREDICTED: group IID secretory phospholipase A2 isoform X3 [Bison bison bison]